MASPSGVELRHGDCLTLMPSLPDGSAALVIADPPYGIGYHSNHYKGKNPHAPVANDWNFQPSAFFRQCERVLRPGGALYLFCRWDVQPLWIPVLNGCGLKVKNVIAWVKDNWSAGDLDGNFGNQYETLLFCVKGRHLRRGRRWSNVWACPRVSHTQMVHPTQKPVMILERAVLASSDPGDLVVDPYAGSGSTGEACVRTGRRAWLAEIDPKMVAVSAKRLNLDVDLALDPTPDETAPAPRFDPPDPAEWGIHPEELRAIHDMILGNMTDGSGAEPEPASRASTVPLVGPAAGQGLLFGEG